jgi:protein-S-isoprenylcysteine O-methyltransferase Ste14
MALRIIGAVMLLPSLAVVLWAFVLARQAVRTKTFSDRGPFRAGRHPIYVASHLALTGFILLVSIWPIVIVLIVTLPVYLIEARSDERKLRSQVEGYEAYAQRTAAVIPFVL